MKKKRLKRLFAQEMESAAYRAPYEEAMEKIRMYLEGYMRAEEKADHHGIESVTCRLKSPKSAMDKLKRKGRDVTPETARRTLNDMAGVRVVCCYYEDVYRVANFLLAQPDLTLVKQKDFICTPKNSGYRSLHLILETAGIRHLPEAAVRERMGYGVRRDGAAGIPEEADDERQVEFPRAGDPSLLPGVRVEVQIRTLTMDVWARLDHELRYKKDVGDAGKIAKALRNCSDSIAQIDDQMQEILDWIREK